MVYRFSEDNFLLNFCIQICFCYRRLYVSIVEQNPSNVGIRGTTLQDLIQ